MNNLEWYHIPCIQVDFFGGSNTISLEDFIEGEIQEEEMGITFARDILHLHPDERVDENDGDYMNVRAYSAPDDLAAKTLTKAIEEWENQNVH
jgi:hypothetical protein